MAGEKLVEKSVEADGFTIRYFEEGEGEVGMGVIERRPPRWSSVSALD